MLFFCRCSDVHPLSRAWCPGIASSVAEGDFWVAPAAAHPQSRGASPAGVPSPRPPASPAPGPAGSLGAIRWQRPISSLFREVFSDGKGEKGICEPCKPIPPSWVNKGSSVGSGMPEQRDGIKEQPLPCPGWGAAGGDPRPLLPLSPARGANQGSKKPQTE